MNITHWREPCWSSIAVANVLLCNTNVCVSNKTIVEIITAIQKKIGGLSVALFILYRPIFLFK